MKTRGILSTLILALTATLADETHGQNVKKGALGHLPRIEIDRDPADEPR